MRKDFTLLLDNKLNDFPHFSGVLAINQGHSSRNPTRLYEKTSGFAERENQRHNRIDTRFGIASGAKLFTAIAICQLVDQKKLTFDTPLSTFLKEDCFDENVTIHHLLSHTSGIPDYFDEEIMSDFSELWLQTPMYTLKEPKDFLPLIMANKTLFRPGEKFHYNNGAFVILAYIVEQVSKLTFPTYIQNHIFNVLHMDSSGYFPMDCLPSNCAYGYEQSNDYQWKKNIYSIPIIGGGDGGVFTTAEDLSKLWEGLIHFQLLSEELTTQLLAPKVYVGYDVVFYGYGIWIVKQEHTIIKYYITGSDPGVSFESAFYPEENIQVILLANTELDTYEVIQHVESVLFP
jgi:CubicO group peptidase (beta-lactamase class C family)